MRVRYNSLRRLNVIQDRVNDLNNLHHFTDADKDRLSRASRICEGVFLKELSL